MTIRWKKGYTYVALVMVLLVLMLSAMKLSGPQQSVVVVQQIASYLKNLIPVKEVLKNLDPIPSAASTVAFLETFETYLWPPITLSFLETYLWPSITLSTVMAMLKAFITYYKIWYKLSKVYNKWQKSNEKPICLDYSQLISRPNQLRYLFFISHVSEIDHTDCHITPDSVLIVKAQFVLRGYFYHYQAAIQLPQGQYQNVALIPSYDKKSCILTVDLKGLGDEVFCEC